MPTLGRYIQRRRSELGLTQEELAEKVGSSVRQAEISRLENDRVVLPRRQRLEQLAAALDVPLGTLLARSGWAGAEGEFKRVETLAADRYEQQLPPSQGDATVASDAIGPRPGTVEPVAKRGGVTPFQAAMANAELQIIRSERAIEQAQSAYEAMRNIRDDRPEMRNKASALGN